MPNFVFQMARMISCPTWESELAKLTISSLFTHDTTQKYSDSSPQVYLSLFALLFIADSSPHNCHFFPQIQECSSIFKYVTSKVQATLMFGSSGRNHGSFQVTALLVKES